MTPSQTRTLLILTLLALVMPIGALQRAEPLYTLQLACPSTLIASGDGVTVTVTETNTSQAPIDVLRTPGKPPFPLGEMLFPLTVTDSRGQPAPPTAFGRRFSQAAFIGSFIRSTIEPGGSMSWTIALTKFFDMTLPGQYTVRATSRSDPAIHSNDLVITVQETVPHP